MHEVSLGGTLADYLTGEDRECTTYEDLRQALARYLVEEKGFAREELLPRFPVLYQVNGEEYSREADVAVLSPSGDPRLLLLFCPGQIHTYARELIAMCRLALPGPCPLGVVTDMRDAELVRIMDGTVIAEGLAVLPQPVDLERLAADCALQSLDPVQRDRESRILHAYTGFLKTCCGENCSLP